MPGTFGDNDPSDPKDPRDSSDPSGPSEEAPSPDAFAAMLRSMGVDPNAGADVDKIKAPAPGGPTGPLGPLLAMLGGQGATFPWDAARQTAIWTAAGGGVEPPVDPLDRIKILELCSRAAEALNEATGFNLRISTGAPVAKPNGLGTSTQKEGPKDLPIEVQVTTKAGWAAEALDDYRERFEAMSAALSKPTTQTEPERVENPLQGLFGGLAPMLLGGQAGAAVGAAAGESVGTFDVMACRRDSRLTLSVSLIDAFAKEWAVPVETARLHFCLVDLCTMAILQMPQVRSRLAELFARHDARSSFDVEGLAADVENRIESAGFDPEAGAVDVNALSSLSSLDPSQFLGRSAEQVAIQNEIEVFLRPILGYAEYMVAITGARLIGDNRQVMEAWKRRRTGGTATRNLGRLLGVNISAHTFERGAAFVGGVLQRAGSDGLALLWSDPENLPTAAELEAPGLWLARLGVDS